MSLQVANKRKSTSSGLGRNTQKLDAVVDGKLPDDLNSTSILKLSDGSRDDIYSRCRIKFANYTVQTQDPHFMDLGLLAINTLNESGVLGTTATRIRRPTNGPHWSEPNHVFGEATVVVMSA